MDVGACIQTSPGWQNGVPPELLTLVDQAVEIPQMGVIRSLNAHVSTAVCIWEYTRQHICKQRAAADNLGVG